MHAKACGCRAAAWLFILSNIAAAHHGIGAQFDSSSIAELEGEITAVLWRNPHVRFTLSVTDEEGQETLWDVEGSSPSMLRQRNITDVLLTVGERVRVAGLTSRRDRKELHVTNVLLPDGREVVFSDSGEPRWSDRALGKSGPRYATEGDSPKDETDIFRVWSQTRAHPYLFGNFDLNAFPLTEAARAAAAAYEPLRDRPSANECAPTGMPSIMNQPYPLQFVDRGQEILLRLELYDTVRTIHMDEAPPGLDEPNSRLGYSVGHWQGNTLVVDTTRIGWGFFYRGIPLSDAVETVEHFTPSEDGSRLNYRLTVTDPATFTRPVELQKYWLYVPGVTVQPYECLEG